MADKDIDKLAKEIVSLKDNPVIQGIEGKQKLDYLLIQKIQNRVNDLEEQLYALIKINEALVPKIVKLEKTLKGKE